MASGSDAIILESSGHFTLIDMGEDYNFPDGSKLDYPDRFGISRQNELVLEDRLFHHLDHLGVKRFDFILGTHVHSDHIETADEVLKRYPVIDDGIWISPITEVTAQEKKVET